MVEVGQPWNEFNWLIQARSEWRNFWTSCIDVKYSQTDRSVRDLGSQRYLLGTSASHCLQKRGLPNVLIGFGDDIVKFVAFIRETISRRFTTCHITPRVMSGFIVISWRIAKSPTAKHVCFFNCFLLRHPPLCESRTLLNQLALGVCWFQCLARRLSHSVFSFSTWTWAQTQWTTPKAMDRW